MMNIEELILGFDARVIRLESETICNPDQRNLFLFRSDVLQTFSTDPMVWPSVFDFDEVSCHPYVGFYQNLWEDLDNLQENLKTVTNCQLEPAFVIAITLLYGICEMAEKQAWDALLRGVSPIKGQTSQPAVMPSTIPATLDNAWSFLGYDVSDQWGLSALSNCGFNPETDDIQALRTIWGSRLNKHHLFDRLDDAIAFRELSNKRIEEHAPFFIFGIWLIGQVVLHK